MVSHTVELGERLGAKTWSWAKLGGSCSRSFVATQYKPVRVRVCTCVCACVREILSERAGQLQRSIHSAQRLMSLSCSENPPSLHHSDLFLSVLPSRSFSSATIPSSGGRM